MTELKKYIDLFSHLHTAKIKEYKAPHKAVLLIAMIDLVEEEWIATPRVKLTERLVKRFEEVWKRYLGTSPVFSPDISKPFFHMQHEEFWRLVEHEDAEAVMVAEDHPFVAIHKTTKELPRGGYSVKAMRNAFAFAEIDARLFHLLQNADARAMLRVTLINTYLANQPTKTMPDLAIIFISLPLALLA